MKAKREIIEALTGLYIASKYHDKESIKYRIEKCDELNITNFAQNICMYHASKDKSIGTNESQINAIIEEAGERLLGRSEVYPSVLIYA